MLNTTRLWPLAGALGGAALIGLTGLASSASANGCHHGILRDARGIGTHGWHFHTRACVRRDVAPPGYASAPHHSPEGVRGSYRTPFCGYHCRFVGPVKTCQQVCR